MQSALTTTHRIELVLSVEEAKRLNKVSQSLWNHLKESKLNTVGFLAFTDKDIALFEALYQHTAAATVLEG